MKTMALDVLNAFSAAYTRNLVQGLKSDPSLIETFTAFLILPEKIVLHVGRTHIGIEYYGPERMESLPSKQHKLEVEILDYTFSDEDFFESVIGFPIEGAGHKAPLSGLVQDLIMPSNDGFDELSSLGWNFAAQDMLMILGSTGFLVAENYWLRLVNAYFFSRDRYGLRTRHIKWIDFVPLKYDDSGPEFDSIRIDFGPFSQFVEADLHYLYPLPEDNEFRFQKLPIINRFIELFGRKSTSETEITKFIAKSDHQFILLMKFGATKLFSELLCEWKTEDKEPIKPDFFILQPNGFADIVEFKLPNLKRRSIIGRKNRTSFSAEITAYIAQTRVYQAYFDDPTNRMWFKNKYGFDVYKPKRCIVAGRRSDFQSQIWKEILDDFKDVQLLTYDDIVDGTVAQFYRR